MNCILLFDIDGTLVSRSSTGRSAGVRAMSQAAYDMTGKPNLADGISFAGATDLDVARQLLELGGVTSPTDTQKNQLLEYYVNHIHQLIEEDAYVALGTPRTVIPALASLGAVIGLGTGNVRKGAECKLNNAGIADLFQFELGGYGEDGEVRADLLRIGVKRCRPYAQTPNASVIVVGDTPRDVEAALTIGAKCIGIPAGTITANDLYRAGAVHVVKEISHELIDAVKAVL
ncbi:MAG: HAD hydrolase-like protein [Deltaproteobacteria bacterium]|nr:HAD hydrolase-like protein [Deltaproteobacteria bacterium]